MKNLIQPFHLVTISPWPLMTSMNLLLLTVNMVKMFNNYNNQIFLTLMLLMINSFYWWRDVIRESTFQGFHNMIVLKGIKLGMILFIISEIFFFLSFFWTYFHMFLSPSMEISMNWPPLNLINLIINPYHLPLLNTIILVSSGMFLSMAHYSLLKKNLKMNLNLMFLTILFGLIFTYIQFIEYNHAMFSINNSVYSSTFYMMTGFHGIHVIVGTIFIIVTFFRLMNLQMSNIHHLSFEMSAWYWHFVDVIWLFLFLLVYWWPFN